MRGVTGVVMALVALSASPLWAQDDVKQQLDALRKEVEALKQERTLNQTQKVEADAARKDAGSGELMAAQAAPLNPLMTLFKETKISGFVDTGYVYNRHQPDSKSNVVRAFDNTANSFYLHNAQLNFERAASSDMVIGYKIELSVGSDADAFDASGDGDVDNFDVQEAYAEILLPSVPGLKFFAGKFVTLAGSEVIESKENYNYSRGLLFTWAIPFTHTGVRAQYSLAEDKVKILVGYVNGWDNMVDNNNAQTWEFQLAVTPVPNVSAFVNVYHGAEGNNNNAGEDGNKRTLLDLILVATFDKLTVGANFDWGWERFDEDEQVHGERGATWNGYALYVKYQVVDWMAPVIRFERFRDEEGYRTGTHQNLTDITFTLDFRVGQNMIVRIEYRYDESSEEIFRKGSSHDREKQDTIGAEVIVTF